MLRCYTVLWLSIMTMVVLVEGYTEEEVPIRCAPCSRAHNQVNLPHPTDCGKYFYCRTSFPTEWKSQICPASTSFNPSTERCTDSRNFDCPMNNNPNYYLDQDILTLSHCAPEVVVMMSSAQPVATTEPTAKGKTEKITTILAALLATTFVVLVLTVVAIFLYRRRQKRRRPTNFYRRRLPESGGGKTKPGPPAAAATNVSYSTRPLLNDRDSCISGVYEDPQMSDEGGYMEIPNRQSQAYYSTAGGDENGAASGHRPAIPVPNEEYMIPSDTSQGHHYSPTTESPGYDKAGPEYLTVEEPYDYCKPETAHPTLSMQRGRELPPAPESPPVYMDPDYVGGRAAPINEDVEDDNADTYVDPDTQNFTQPDSTRAAESGAGRPDSPPYYVDPIPMDYPASNATQNYPYHTLEPLQKKS